MAYVSAEPCIDVNDKGCVEECTVEAIFYKDDVPEQWSAFTAENAKFFDQLGSPGGASRTARCPTTPNVASYVVTGR